MATVNTPLTNEWQKVAETADDPVLMQSYGKVAQVEYATTDDDEAPDSDLIGHRLEGHEAMTRLVLGEGYIWVRLYASAKAATLVITGSTAVS